MPTTPTLAPEQWIDFAEAGNQQRFNVQDGTPFQGWIMEITDEALLISSGEGAQGQNHWVKLTDIELNSLSFFDIAQQAWQPFKVNER